MGLLSYYDRQPRKYELNNTHTLQELTLQNPWTPQPLETPLSLELCVCAVCVKRTMQAQKKKYIYI